jgi:hypothetical protein
VYDLDDEVEAKREAAMRLQMYWATRPNACEPGCTHRESFIIRDMFTGSVWVDEPEA